MASILIINEDTGGIPLAMEFARLKHICKVYSLQDDIPNALQGEINPCIIPSIKDVEQYDLILNTAFNLPGKALSTIQESNRVIGAGNFHTALLDEEYVKSTSRLIYKQEELKTTGRGITLTGLFNGIEFLPFHVISQHHNRLFDGDLGPSVGLMGLVCSILPPNSRLSETYLHPLTDLLTKVKFIGPISVTLRHDQHGMGFHCLSTSIVPCLTQAVNELLRTDVFDLYWGLLEKKLSIMKTSGMTAICTHLTAPPFPCGRWNGIHDLISPPPEALPHFWMQDVFHDVDRWMVCGSNVGWVSARGANVREAQRRVLRTVRNATISQDVMYRTDIGCTFEETLHMLKEEEWL